MRSVAIDDEPLALSIIQSYFGEYAPQHTLECYNNPIEGMKAISSERPDVVFMDIEMNDYSGLELARELPFDTILIFTTAHASYALDGYEVNAVDFLHKPFSGDRFRSAIERAEQILNIRNMAKNGNAPTLTTHITIKVDYQNITIPTASIRDIEAMDNYVKINREGQPPLLSKMSIKYIMELLPDVDFIRIHRSFIVARRCISSYTKTRVHLDCDKSLPVGRNYAESLFQAMIKEG